MELSQEAYFQIINYLDNPADVCSLCRVSKVFQRVAEPALYRRLHMQGALVAGTICNTIASQARLSSHVKEVTMDLSDPQYSDDDGNEMVPVPLPSGFWDDVARALRSTTHLLYLNIRGGDTSTAWTLNGTAFRLRTLHCDLNWDGDLVSFLSKQFDLTDLYIVDYNENAANMALLDSRSMPKLSTLECTFPEAASGLVPGRPVTHLKTCFSRTEIAEKRTEMSLLLSKIRLSTRPLNSLDIADTTYTEGFGLELLAAVIHALPTGNLRYLGTLALPRGGRKRLEFYGLLMRIPRLECLEVDVTDWEPQPTLLPNALRAIASELRLYTPTVMRVVFVNEFDRTVVGVVNGWCVLDKEVDTEVLWRNA